MLAQKYRRAKPYLIYSVSFCTIFLVTLWLLRRTFGSPVSLPLAPADEWDAFKDISNATLGFGKIFVVNLPARTDRRDAMTLGAAFSDLALEWIDATTGDEVLVSTLPLDKTPESPPRPGDKGAWRAHLNAIRAVVEQGLTSALIMEDDLDWDIRIRDQLRNFALSARALLQPLSILSIERADPTYPQAFNSQEIVEIPFADLPDTAEPRTSLYGDYWDVLWIGHCGMEYPQVPDDMHSLGRVIQLKDETVLSRKHNAKDLKGGQYMEEYPDHTRVYNHVVEAVCSHAYAVTQQAARRILWEMSVSRYTAPFDIMLEQLCDGKRSIERKLTCITTQPALFKHWKPRGWINESSDIGDMGADWNDIAGSDFIRWSVGVNMERFVRGEVGDWKDQYTDIDGGQEPHNPV